MSRDEILAKVFIQIEKDVYVYDFTSIAEMLKDVPDDVLIEYLPEGD